MRLTTMDADHCNSLSFDDRVLSQRDFIEISLAYELLTCTTTQEAVLT